MGIFKNLLNKVLDTEIPFTKNIKVPTVRDDGKTVRERMEAIGLTMYEWSTCLDERVRLSHALMEGKICKWADPAVCSTNGKTWKPRPKGAPLAHPGEEEGCRCTALSYDKELMG